MWKRGRYYLWASPVPSRMQCPPWCSASCARLHDAHLGRDHKSSQVYSRCRPLAPWPDQSLLQLQSHPAQEKGKAFTCKYKSDWTWSIFQKSYSNLHFKKQNKVMASEVYFLINFWWWFNKLSICFTKMIQYGQCIHTLQILHSCYGQLLISDFRCIVLFL